MCPFCRPRCWSCREFRASLRMWNAGVAAGSFLTFAVGISETHRGRMKLLTLLLRLCAEQAERRTLVKCQHHCLAFYNTPPMRLRRPLISTSCSGCGAHSVSLHHSVTLFCQRSAASLGYDITHQEGLFVPYYLFSEFDSPPLVGSGTVPDSWCLLICAFTSYLSILITSNIPLLFGLFT